MDLPHHRVGLGGDNRARVYRFSILFLLVFSSIGQGKITTVNRANKIRLFRLFTSFKQFPSEEAACRDNASPVPERTTEGWIVLDASLWR
jgi:hypothetical protein